MRSSPRRSTRRALGSRLRALRVDPRAAGDTDLVGRVLCHDVAGVRKGTVVAATDLAALRTAPELHLAVLDPGDVHEDEASVRLAAALAGPGLEARPPVQSQVRLVAVTKGLFRASSSAVDELNALGPVSVFTLVDGQAVEAGEEVAGAKVTPVAVPGAVVESAEAICERARPVAQVLRFRPLRTLVVATEKLKPKARELFRAAVTKKLGWFGADLLGVLEVARSAEAVRSAYAQAREAGAELVLFAGASSIDPLDPAYLELRAAGGEVLQQGAPMHPGSMLWLGRLGAAPVLGVASCAGFGRSTSLDLVLPFVFAYGQPDAAHLRRLGPGGLIESGAGRRFPPYG